MVRVLGSITIKALSLEQDLKQQKVLAKEFDAEIKLILPSNIVCLKDAMEIFREADLLKTKSKESDVQIPQLKKEYKKEMRRIVSVFRE